MQLYLTMKYFKENINNNKQMKRMIILKSKLEGWQPLVSCDCNDGRWGWF